MHKQLAVLGGGPGGYAAAFLAADLGLDVALIDAEPRLGGTCLLRGCIPSKALLHVAGALDTVRRLDQQWGISYGSPSIDIEKIRSRQSQLIAGLSNGLSQLAKRRKVEVISARGRFIDSSTLELFPTSEPAPEGTDEPIRQLTFDHAIVATGSGPTPLPGDPCRSPRIWNSSRALQIPEIPASLLIIGGGYIGLELGTVYAELGSRVSVVEMTDALLPGVDADLVRPLARRLKHLFNDRIHLSSRITQLAESDDEIQATWDSANGTVSESFSNVLVAIGRRPATDGLRLDRTGAQLDHCGFVRCDARQRTDDSRILAIGDVAGEPMLAHHAVHQAKIAVETLLELDTTATTDFVPAVVFTDPEIAWVGLTERAAREAGTAYRPAVYPWAASGRAQAIGRTDGLTKWLVDTESEKLLGCGIVGHGAAEMISEATLAIERQLTARDVADTIHPHPTLSETLTNAAEVFYGSAIDIYKPRRT